MELIQLYKESLAAMNAVADDSGALSLHSVGKTTPITVGEKRLCLPTREVLSVADFSKVMVFHPLSEDIMKGESAVLQKTRNLVLLRLTTSIKLLATELMAMASDHGLHASLSPEQQKVLLTPLSKADPSTFTQLSKILASCSPTKQNRILSLYLKHGGKLNKVGYARAGIVAFPLIEALDAEDRKVYGELLKVTNVKMIKALFDIILPGATKVETYSYGSNSKVAPYFHALLGAFVNVAQQLNKVAEQFKDKLTAFDDIYIPLDWAPMAADLTPYNNKLDPMEGNLGTIIDTPEVEETLNQIKTADVTDIANDGIVVKPENRTPVEVERPATANALALGARPVPAPVVPEPPANKLSWADIVNQRAQQAQQQPAGWQQPGFPQPGLYAPMANQYPPAGNPYGNMGGSANHVRGAAPSWQSYPGQQQSNLQYPQQGGMGMMTSLYSSL